MNADLIFIEQTLFVIFLWAGAYGLIDHWLSHVSKNTRVIIYSLLVLGSCSFLYARGHTKKLASL